MPIRTAVLLLLVLGTSVFATPVFHQPLPIDVGRQYYLANGGMATGDFNGDSWPDVAMSHPDGRLVVALNASGGPGPFAASLITAAPQYMNSLAAGDVNNDGKLDLVGFGAASLQTLFGNGDGTFTPGPAVYIPTVTSGLLVLGDINADGKLDAVVASDDYYAFDILVTTFLGAGNGQFSFGDQEELYTPAESIALGHLNGDTRLDVVVGGWSVQAFLSGAGGALTQSWTRSMGSPVPIALAQIDAGSTVDLVVADDTLDIYSGNNNGTFTLASTHLAPALGQLVCADVTNDGVLDVVGRGWRTLTVFRGLGGGNFAPSVSSVVGSEIDIAVHDFDRDTKQDIVGMTPGDINSLMMLRGNGNGTFGTDRAYRVFSPHDYYSPFGGAVTDMNGDNRADIVSVDRPASNELYISVLMNDGTGKLIVPAVSTLIGTGFIEAFQVGRMNADNYPDVVVVREGEPATATTYFGQAGGTFTPGATSPVEAPYYFPEDWMRLVDLTGDGVDELLFERVFHPGNSDGSFGAAVTTMVSTEAVGDVDGNGTVDLVGFSDGSEYHTAVALNTGGGVFAFPVNIPSAEEGWPSTLGDFDGDGKLDLLSMTNIALRIHKGAGNGTFGAPSVVLVDSFDIDNDVVTAEFDGDGKLDVLVAGRSLFLGDGNGRFRDLQFIPGGWRDPGVGDFDGNGSPDVAFSDGGEFRVHFSRLQPAPTAVSGTTLASDTVDAKYAMPIDLTAQVYGNAVPATGAVIFALEGVTYAINRMDIHTGSMTLMKSTLERAFPVGTHHFIATYTGNMAYQPSSSVTLVQQVDRAATSLSQTGNSQSTYGGTAIVNFVRTAPVVDYLPGPTGEFHLMEGATEIVDNVTWHYPDSTLKQVRVERLGGAGAHTLTIEYDGDASYEPSTSPTFTHTVHKRTPSVLHTFLPTATPDPGPVTINVTVTHSAELPTTGEVSFVWENSIVGTDDLENGAAGLTTTLQAGTHVGTINYGGDANNNAVSKPISITVYAGPWGTPIVLQATASANSADIRWTPVRTVYYYTVYRKTSYAGVWQPLYNTSAARYFDPMPANTTYMYYVLARNGQSPQITMATNTDLATSVVFGDDPLVPGIPFKSPHISQLRTAVNAVRVFSGLEPYPFTDGSLAPGMLARAAHVTELRAALAEARDRMAMPVVFTDPTITPGVTPFRALHLEELRGAVR